MPIVAASKSTKPGCRSSWKTSPRQLKAREAARIHGPSCPGTFQRSILLMETMLRQRWHAPEKRRGPGFPGPLPSLRCAGRLLLELDDDVHRGADAHGDVHGLRLV